jgi:hypothetical protein
MFSVGWSTALHEHMPQELMSREFSYDATGAYVAIPPGQLLPGPLTWWSGCARWRSWEPEPTPA